MPNQQMHCIEGIIDNSFFNYLFASPSNYLNVSGAMFILYNCARLAEILRQFEEKVQLGYYPQLIPYEEVDFLLLSKEVSYLSYLNCVARVVSKIIHFYCYGYFLTDVCLMSSLSEFMYLISRSSEFS
jgi:hypothetical protein